MQEQGLSEGTMGFWRVCWDSWISPHGITFYSGTSAVGSKPTRRSAPEEAGQGWDGQTPFLLLLMPTLKNQKKRLIMTLPLASTPLSCPLLSSTASPPHSRALAMSTVSPRSCSIAGIVALPPVTLQPRGPMSRAEWRTGRQQQHREEPRVRNRSQATRPDATRGIQGTGRTGMVEMVQVLPSPLCHPVQWETRWSVVLQGAVEAGAMESAKQCQAFHLQMLNTQGTVCNSWVLVSSLELSMLLFPHLKMKKKEAIRDNDNN